MAKIFTKSQCHLSVLHSTGKKLLDDKEIVQLEDVAMFEATFTRNGKTVSICCLKVNKFWCVGGTV